VLELTKDVHFIDKLLLLFIIHPAVVRLLPDHFFTGDVVLYERHFSIASYSTNKLTEKPKLTLTKVLINDRVVLH
jgi:hypothetical protein